MRFILDMRGGGACYHFYTPREQSFGAKPSKHITIISHYDRGQKHTNG